MFSQCTFRLGRRFQRRSDNQITTLEILAVSVGLSSFADLIRERRVVLYSDNKGAEVQGPLFYSHVWVDTFCASVSGEHTKGSLEGMGSV